MAPTGSYAAAVGTTTRSTAGLPIATGTTRPTAGTTGAFAWPVHYNARCISFTDDVPVRM